ncbi:MAG: plasmid recombination protein [Bacilli bacterium]|nr:plasmid recombination protein [Bacilli bacterium]
MSYAIFRCKSINTLNDLSHISSHNKREKESYKSNPDIRIEDSINNIELVKCDKKYREKFYEITKEYRKEHEEKMKTIRQDRYKDFDQMVDDSKSCVADEMIFTSGPEFFKEMSKEEILRWANGCMEFVYKDLGYTKEQVLHSVLHLDEKTPHIHCVVVPLVKKFDKRVNKERYSISKRDYIKDQNYLSILQDKYCFRLNNLGFKLERGEKGTKIKNLSLGQLKGITRQYERLANKSKKNIESEHLKIINMLKFLKKKAFSDSIILNGESYHILLKYLDLYTKEIQNQAIYQNFFNDLDDYIFNYKELEKEYNYSQKVIDNLEEECEKLDQNNNNLIDFIKYILEMLKDFFRRILLSKNENDKNKTVNILKECYEKDLYNSYDLIDISKNTDKEIEVNDFIKEDILEKEYDYFD